MVCGRRECCCEDQLKRAGHQGRSRGGEPCIRVGEDGGVGQALLRAYSLWWHLISFPTECTCLLPSLCACSPCSPPPAAVRSAATVVPHPRGLLAKYRNDSVSGRGAAGRLPRVLLRPEGGRRGNGVSYPTPIASSHTFKQRQAQKGLKGLVDGRHPPPNAPRVWTPIT